MNNRTFELLLGDFTPTADINNAVWFKIHGEGPEIRVIPQPVPGRSGDWRQCFSAFNAFSDMYYTDRYVHAETGLHLFGKTVDRFAGLLGYIHVTSESADFPIPTVDEFPSGWAQLECDRVTGEVKLTHMLDTRDAKTLELAYRYPHDGRYDAPEVQMARKHDWVDALLTGRPLLIRVAGMRQYVLDRVESWGLDPDQARIMRGAKIGVSRERKIMRYDYLEANGKIVTPVAVEPEPEPAKTPTVTSIIFRVKQGGTVDLMQIKERFLPLVYDKRGKVYSTTTFWEPERTGVQNMFAKWAEMGFSLSNLPANQ